MKLWFNVCFHYVDSRLNDFYKLIDNLENLKQEKKIIINSNTNFNNKLNIDVATLSDPFHLTWEHKKYMSDFLESDYTHFIYLEGNTIFTQENIDYWIETKELFDRNNINLIPALHRVQKGKDGRMYSLDCTRRTSRTPAIEVEGKKFISLQEFYHGMFIMDKQLVREHMSSDYFIIGQKGWYGIRESANLGNLLINVPQGFQHRAVVPLDNFDRTWMTHFGTDYHNNPLTGHAKIAMDDLWL